MTEPPGRFAFALASCQYPGGLLDRGTRVGTPRQNDGGPVPRPNDTGLAYRSIARLDRRQREHGARLVLLCGDSVYADDTAGLFDPASLDESLHNVYGALRAALGRLRLGRAALEAMLDDHEIRDNWEPERAGEPTAEQREQRRAGARAYIDQWRIVSKVPLRNYWVDKPLWFAFEQDGFRFFMADTRTARSHRAAATLDDACILGEPQWQELEQWIIDAPRDRPSFLLSPSIVLPRRLAVRDDALAAIRSDAWDGYPGSLRALLRRLLDVGNDKIVLLSGDEHLSCVSRIALARASAPRRPTVIHSIQSSALYAPYPFANSIPDDLAGSECFTVADVSDAELCGVDTWFPPPGDGFALVTVERDSRGWSMQVSFDRADGSHIGRYRL